MPNLFSRVSGAEIVRALLALSIATISTITTAAKRGGAKDRRAGGGGGGGSGPQQGNTDHSMNRALKWAYAIRQSTGQTRNRPIVALEKLDLTFGRPFCLLLSFFVFIKKCFWTIIMIIIINTPRLYWPCLPRQKDIVF